MWQWNVQILQNKNWKFQRKKIERSTTWKELNNTPRLVLSRMEIEMKKHSNKRNATDIKCSFMREMGNVIWKTQLYNTERERVSTIARTNVRNPFIRKSTFYFIQNFISNAISFATFSVLYGISSLESTTLSFEECGMWSDFEALFLSRTLKRNWNWE